MLVDAARRGLRVVVLTVAQNNFRVIRLCYDYLLHLLQESGAHVHNYDCFSHARYLIVDRREVLFGSSNLGYSNHHIFEELCMQSDDPPLVEAFVNELFLRDLPHTRRSSVRPDLGDWPAGL